MSKSSILVVFHFVELFESVIVFVTATATAGIVVLDLATVLYSTVSVVAIEIERDSTRVLFWVSHRVLENVPDHFQNGRPKRNGVEGDQPGGVGGARG